MEFCRTPAFAELRGHACGNKTNGRTLITVNVSTKTFALMVYNAWNEYHTLAYRVTQLGGSHSVSFSIRFGQTRFWLWAVTFWPYRTIRVVIGRYWPAKVTLGFGMAEISTGDCTTLDVIGTLWVTRIIKFTVLAIVIELFWLPNSFFTNIMQNSQMFSTTYLTAVSGNTTFTAMQTAATAKIKLVFSEKNSKFRSPWPFLKGHGPLGDLPLKKINKVVEQHRCPGSFLLTWRPGPGIHFGASKGVSSLASLSPGRDWARKNSLREGFDKLTRGC